MPVNDLDSRPSQSPRLCLLAGEVGYVHASFGTSKNLALGPRRYVPAFWLVYCTSLEQAVETLACGPCNLAKRTGSLRGPWASEAELAPQTVHTPDLRLPSQRRMLSWLHSMLPDLASTLLYPVALARMLITSWKPLPCPAQSVRVFTRGSWLCLALAASRRTSTGGLDVSTC